jgi:hypothetical protein
LWRLLKKNLSDRRFLLHLPKSDCTLPQYKRDRHSQNNQFLQRDRFLNKQSLLIGDNPGS